MVDPEALEEALDGFRKLYLDLVETHCALIKKVLYCTDRKLAAEVSWKILENTTSEAN